MAGCSDIFSFLCSELFCKNTVKVNVDCSVAECVQVEGSRISMVGPWLMLLCLVKSLIGNALDHSSYTNVIARDSYHKVSSAM